MHVVVVGCGRVGSRLATVLNGEGHTVTIIDKNQAAFRRLMPGSGVRQLVGFGFDRDTLVDAGAERADALAAVTSGDNSNILTARIARETFQIPAVVARIYDPRRAEIYQRLGIVTVATVAWTIDQVLRGLFPARSGADWTDPTGRVELIERLLPPEWAGRAISVIEDETGARVVAVTRSGVPQLGPSNLIGQTNDLLHLAVEVDREPELFRALGEQTAVDAGREVKVVIAGAGAVGTFLAEDLSDHGHEVLLIEKNPLAVPHLGEPTIQVVVADACEVDVLQDAQLELADVVIAVTGDDEDNLVISLLAKQEFAVPRVIARVNHPKNHWLFNENWGVDVAVSTPHLISALVEEAVSVGSIVRLLQFESAGARLIEVTLAVGSPAAGSMIGQIGLPRDTAIVAVLRDGHVVVPRSDTLLSAGDEVLLLVSLDAEERVRSLLVTE